MAVIILVIFGMIASGAIGYFLAYIKNEKENRKSNKKIRNPKSGWYLYC